MEFDCSEVRVGVRAASLDVFLLRVQRFYSAVSHFCFVVRHVWSFFCLFVLFSSGISVLVWLDKIGRSMATQYQRYQVVLATSLARIFCLYIVYTLLLLNHASTWAIPTFHPAWLKLFSIVSRFCLVFFFQTRVFLVIFLSKKSSKIKFSG